MMPLRFAHFSSALLARRLRAEVLEEIIEQGTPWIPTALSVFVIQTINPNLRERSLRNFHPRNQEGFTQERP